MKNRHKMCLHWLVSTVICFILIYLFIFFGGWKLAESGDPILLEILAAIAMGSVFWILYEVASDQNRKIQELEKRIAALESRSAVTAEHPYCPYLQKQIDPGLCYDMQMISGGYVSASALSDVEFEKEELQPYCNNCEHRI